MISIIPKPLSLLEGKSSFVATARTSVGGEFIHAISKLQSSFAAAGVNLTATKLSADISFVLDTTMEQEQYSLLVSESSIVITASTEQGAFYAVQSIRLACLIDTLRDVAEIVIPEMTIEDKPRFSHRGFMLDEGRHFFGKTIVKEFLDMLALNKMNIFHWHLTEDQGWRIEIKKYPELTSHGSKRSNTQLNLVGYATLKELHDNTPYGEGLYYSQDDIREIVAYAADLHINVIPEIDLPGHVIAAISCYPELSCTGDAIDVSNRWGVLDTIGCVGGDKFMPFVYDVLDEICELFPYNYFHIGGDEVPKTKWKKCPKCQAKIKELGIKNENELQGWFNNQVLEYVKLKGKNLIGWNEILEAAELSDETLVQWWIGSSKSNGVDKWLGKGNKIIMSNCPFLYMDHFYAAKDLKKTYSLDLDTAGLDSKYESSVLGIEAPQWTEYIRSVDKLHFNCYPRIQAIAEINWTAKDKKDFDDFEYRLASQNSIMDALGINYATRDAYLSRGFKGLRRAIRARAEWVVDPDTEFLRFTRKKPSVK